MREVYNLCKLERYNTGHNHIVRMLGISRHENNIVLQLQLATKGDVNTFIRNLEYVEGMLRHGVSEDRAFWFMYQAVSAVHFCHLKVRTM